MPPGYQSLYGTYSRASPSSQPLTMSTKLTDPTLQGLTSDQYINMISSNVGNPQANPIGSYYPPRGKPSYPPPGGQPFVGNYPTGGGKPPTLNYPLYGHVPQTGLGQFVVSQPIVGTPFPGMNTIWNSSYNQESFPVAP